MKIQKIEIEQFGGLKGFTLELFDGAQYIYGLNEAGKSTLCAFLAAMFYGLPSKVRGGGLRGDSRSLYMPWGESYMAGSLYFEAEGTEYVLKRRFGQTARGDKTSLLTAGDWQEVAIATEDIGRRFLGVGEEAFYKTLFIGQLGAAFEKGKEDELMARLSNLEQTGDEDTSAQKALLELERAQHELVSKTGRGGAIIQLDGELEALKSERLETEQRHVAFQSLLFDIRRMTEEKETAEKQLVSLTEKQKRAAAFLEYQKYKESVLEKETLLKRLQQEKAALLETQKKLSELEIKRAEFSSVLSLEPKVIPELAEKEATIGVLKKHLSEISALEQEVAALTERIHAEREKKQKYRIPLIALMVLFAVLTVVLGVLVSPIFFGATIAFVFGAFAGLRERGGGELITLEVKLSEKEASLARMQEENAAEKLSVLQAELQTIFKIAQAESLAELTKKQEAGKALVYQIREMEQTQNRYTESINATERALDNLPETEEKPEVTYEGEPAQELEKLRESLQQEQLDRERMLAQLSAKAENGFSGIRSIAEIESDIESALEQRRQLQENYEAITLAKTTLEVCIQELKNTFAPALNQKAGTLISALTGGRYQEVRVTDAYKIMLKTPEGTDIVPAEFVSAGTYDLLYFALRMAVLLTLQSEIPLLIMDDTFMQLDEKRQQNAFGWLGENQGQILYFSCHRPPEAWQGKVLTI